jgi:hypothetical protein
MSAMTTKKPNATIRQPNPKTERRQCRTRFSNDQTKSTQENTNPAMVQKADSQKLNGKSGYAKANKPGAATQTAKKMVLDFMCAKSPNEKS